MNADDLDVLELIELMKKLQEVPQTALGWLITGTGSIVEYEGQPGLASNIQEKLKGTVGALSIIYLFSLFESYFPYSLWVGVMSDDELKTMKAYRHIRHTFAHGIEGKRAKNQKSDFDNVMASKPIPNVNLLSDDKLSVHHTIGMQLVNVMYPIAQNATATVAKHQKY